MLRVPLSRLPTSQVLQSARRSATTIPSNTSYKVVVIGGGPGGLSVSSTLSSILGPNNVAVIEPSDVHYNQPLWTFVGGGLKSFDQSRKPMEEVIAKEVDWIKKSAAGFEPNSNVVILDDGQKISYDYLVVAAGIQINWDSIKGLKGALGKDGVTSNYSADSVQRTWEFVNNFKGGNAIFTMPSTPIKCAGAPQKIMYLAEEQFRANGIRDKAQVIYNTGIGKIFGIDKYASTLSQICQERGITVNTTTELTEIRPENREAVFKKTGPNGSEEQVYNYDFLHVAPPMGAPDFIKKSPIADKAGWVEVDPATLQHTRYSNIFSLGDCSSCPTGKTAAAVASESQVVKKNLLSLMAGKSLNAKYDGYTSCPLVTGKSKLVLAEFSGYTSKPLETFPVNQAEERSSMYYLTAHALPELYWSGLLKGTWHGPGFFRNIFNNQQ
ncbi:mitochondrial sulfide:quinone oxidoreductase [Basidiobolus meristosporus CBS 931.73]|uniref:Sulfide:quinone oxidoreductase, mitochondrial n=1 Tax=Basidiobolus meristosporus CBS 931.73 TaxID=1314790 RepID=A0A1Y1WZD4_9FUNG|nr:mitochondrial sulfide:quinone oxidoreductase [Basidiobolus meristosporus CBS 931.73]|eukprot:ORX78947.1 mitochondrial sulfide:quinone oxidoreductase [Basidiobolus meristosporus CBS 931.73]